jgi:hypothetical protein
MIYNQMKCNVKLTYCIVSTEQGRVDGKTLNATSGVIWEGTSAKTCREVALSTQRMAERGDHSRVGCCGDFATYLRNTGRRHDMLIMCIIEIDRASSR